jgi:hypothetical protein
MNSLGTANLSILSKLLDAKCPCHSITKPIQLSVGSYAMDVASHVLSLLHHEIRGDNTNYF